MMSAYPPEKPIIKGERDHYSRSCTPANSKLCFQLVRGNHEWVIEDFLKREEANGVSLASKFTVSAVDAKGVYYETVWKVKAYPHGCEQDVKDHLSLFITQVSGPEVFCILPGPSHSPSLRQSPYDPRTKERLCHIPD